MTDLLWALLRAGAAGAVAVLAALAVCALLRRARAPGWLLCALWLAVGMRFAVPGGLVPVTLPRPESEGIRQLTETALTVTETLPADTAARAARALDAAGLALDTGEEDAPAFEWSMLIAGVWAAGTLACLGRAGVAGLRLRRRVALACKTPDSCYTCPEVETPFTLGVLRPRIYLPADLTGDARRAVLLHERTHIRRGDNLVKPLYYLVVCLHWWNPLAWVAFARFEHAMECACDEAAVRGSTPAQRTAYCESLLRYAAARAPGGALAFGAPGAGQRILHALRYRAPGKVMLGICVAVAGLAALALLARPTLADGVPAAEPAASPLPAQQAGPAADTSARAGGDVSEGTDTSDPADAALPPTVADGTPGTFEPAGAFIVPVEYEYYSRMMTAYHKGDDLAADEGTPVLAAAGGTVITAQSHYSYGNFVLIDHGADEQGRHWYTLYAHLRDLTAQEGQTVAQGEIIGTVGHTGSVTGNSLHFELHCGDTLLAPTLYLPYTETVPARAAEDEILLPAMLEDPAIANAIAQRAIGSLAPETLEDPLPDKTRISVEYIQDTHKGIDMAAPTGTDILAAADGVVLFAGWHDFYGWTVVLGHGNDSDERPLMTLYAHMDGEPPVLMGQVVSAGQVIGQVGTTGNSTGPHLHFAMLLDGTAVAPQPWLN